MYMNRLATIEGYGVDMQCETSMVWYSVDMYVQATMVWYGGDIYV